MRGSTTDIRTTSTLLATLLLACACEGSAPETTDRAGPAADPGRRAGEVATVRERWISTPDPAADLDSPQVWVSDAGEGWVIVTAKEGDQLHVLDASGGTEVRRVGATGTTPGAFDRPNGIAVWGDLVLVVERDNARVQVLTVPDFEPVGTFGEPELEYPYGITLMERGGRASSVWITDDYEVGAVGADYSRRVHRYEVELEGDSVVARHVASFGAGSAGERPLTVVETIGVDPTYGRLLIADEAARLHRVYTLEGSYTGRDVGAGLIVGDPEGSALYRCGEEGYWILTDQEDEASHFIVIDRRTLAPLGTFRGETTVRTDGVALTRRDVLGSGGGAFFASHDDRAVSAFAWSDIAEGLGLDPC